MKLTQKLNVFISVIIMLSMLSTYYPATAQNMPLSASANHTDAVSQSLEPKQSLYGSGWDNLVQQTGLPVTNLANALASLLSAPQERPIKLDLDVEPAIYIPGVPLTLRWTIKNFDKVDLNGNPRLTIVSQPGVTPQDPSLAKQLGSSYKLIMPITQDNGSITWIVDSTATMPVNIQFALTVGDQDIYDNAVMVDAPQFEVRNGQTTKYDGLNTKQKPANAPEKSKIKINAPADASDEEMLFGIHAPSQHTLPYMSLSANPLEIVAVGESKNKNIKKFNKPITIQLNYDLTEHPSWSEDDLQLYYYDADTFDWYPMATTVDKKNKILTTQSDHLTVFDYKARSWQGYVPPTVDNFKTSLFSGAATYNMSFWVPPAPGGLAPNVNLTYNSQIMDEMPALGQSSWVGAGWNLDTGAIVRNMHGTNNTTDDDTFIIMVDGVSGLLLPVSVAGTVTTYNTANQDFTKVTFDINSNTWKAYSKNGTINTFGGTTDSVANLFTDGACGTPNLPWRWSLASQTDINGKQLTYTYTKDLKTACASGQQSDIAVYPATITYANKQYRVNFVIEPRSDYQTSWTTNTSQTLYGVKRLQRIQIQMSNGGIWNTIRQYVFSYRTVVTGDINDPIYPASPFSNGGLTLTLGGVQEYGNDSVATLPATSFFYPDKMHLGRVKNGQGGQVDITYDRVTFFDDINKGQRSISANYNSGSGQTCDTTEWSAVSGTLRCDGGTTYLQVGDQTDTGKADRTIPESMIKPGARYRLRIDVRPILELEQTNLNYGLIDETTNATAYLSQNGVVKSTGSLELSVDMAASYKATQTRLRLECLNRGCFMREFALVEFLTYYRVVSRTVTDNVTGNNGTYTYHYDEEAPNSSAVSEAIAANGTVYNTALSEFRGHSMSEVVDPQSLATMNFYYQNDTLKGILYHSLVYKQTFFDDLNASLGIRPTYWNTAGNVSLNAVDNISNGAAKITSTTTTNASMVHTATLNGSMAFAQLRINSSDTSTQGEVGLISTGGKFFGVIAKPSTGGTGVFVRTNTGNGLQDSSTALIPGGMFQYNKWYGVLFIIDPNNGFRVRMWQMGDLNNASYESVVSGYTADTWKLRAQANSGTLWFDTPAEGTLFSESTTRYNVATLTAHGSLSTSSLQQYTDLNVVWASQAESIVRTYDAKSTWFGIRNTFDYNTADQNGGQYGNLTRTVASSWNGTAWVDNRANRTEYYPLNNGVKYLVSLPARNLSLSCGGTAGNGSDCDFTGASGLVGETRYLYDNNSDYNVAPSVGLLKKQRVRMDDRMSVKYTEAGYDYDEWGNQTSVTNYNGYATITTSPTSAALTTTRVYDTTYSTYLLSETNPLNQKVSMGYDFTLGVATSLTDANNITTSARYDTFGRIKSIVAPGDSDDSPTLSINYNQFESAAAPYNVILSQKIDANRVVQTVRYYNGLGKLIQTQTLNANVNGINSHIVQDSQYDILGRLTKQTKPYTYTTAFAFKTQTFTQPLTSTSYDILGRVIQVLDANGTHIDTSYDGLTTVQTDANNNRTTRVSDVWGRVASVTTPNAAKTSYGYDKADRLTSVTLAETALAGAMGYDRGGRKISSTDPDMGAWSYDYDALNNLIRQTDAKGQTTCLYYDPIARLKGKLYRTDTSCPVVDPGYSGYAIKYYYDEGGFGAYALSRRTHMEDASGTTSWAYDVRGRVSSETRVLNGLGTFSTSYTYNSADQIQTMTYPNGEVVTMGYNSQDALQSIQNGAGQFYLSNLLYDSAGRGTTLQLGPDGTNPTLTQQINYYDWTTARLGGRLNSLTTTSSANGQVQNVTYKDYDSNGNLLAIDDVVNENGASYTDTSTYTYDALNRLNMSMVKRGATTLYSEEFFFNSGAGLLMSSKKTNGATVSLSYSPTHPHAMTNVGSKTYEYDLNGNQNRRTVNGQVSVLGYDEENHLTSVSGAATANYIYDGDGNLVKSSDSSGGTYYVGQNTEILIPAITTTPTPTQAATPTATGQPVAFPRTGVLDTFNRTDGNLTAPWSFNLGSFAVSGNQCKGNTTSFNDALYKTTVGPDFEVYTTLVTKPGDGGLLYLGGRFDEGRTNGYYIRYVQSAGTDYIGMYLKQGATETQLGSIVYQEVNPGDSLGLSIVGSSITMWYKPVGGNWTSMATATDGTLSTAGYLYLDIYGSLARIDDFGGGTLSGQTPTPTNTATPTPTVTPNGVPSQTVTPTVTGQPAAFPRTSVLDNFNRADGNLTAPWSFNLGSFAVSGSQCKGNTTSFNDTLYKTSFGPDFEVYTTLVTKPGDGEIIYLGGRFDDSRANGYYIRYVQSTGTDYIGMYRDQASTETQLSDIIYQELHPGDGIGMSMVGSAITVWYKPAGGNWTSLGTATDSAITTAGYLYLDVTGDVARIDDFGGGTVAGQPPTYTATPTITPTPTNTATPIATTPSATFPRTGVLDNFDRADGNLIAPWTFVLGSFAVSNNQCKGNTTSFNDVLYKTSYGPDFEVYATIATKPGDGGLVYLGGRFDEGRDNGYFIRYVQSAGTDHITMYLQQNSTETQLGSTVYQELTPGDGIGMSMVGSTMTLWYKPVGGAWTSLATASDSTLTGAGYLYLDVYGDVARIDDFGGGTPSIGLAPQPAQPTWLARVSAAWQGLWSKAGSLARWAQGVQNLWQQVWAKGAYAALGAGRLDLRAHPAAVQSLTTPPAGQVWRNTIWAGDRRIAVHEYTASGDTVSYLLTDHLGSTSVTTDVTGALQSEIRYTAYGETRFTSGVTPTQFQYTGQLSQMDTVGLYYYGARWYDPYLNRFLSPDTIIPDLHNPQSWDRYSYVRNNPVNFTDPTGHIEACEENCSEQRRLNKLYDTLGAVGYFKHEIKGQFGMEMVDSGVKWAKDNLMTAYHALSMINTKLNGYLKSMVGGTTFTITGGGNQYWGQTSSTGVTYHVVNGNTKIPLNNFLHETGHLLDFVPATKDVFSDPFRPAKGGATPSWVKDGYVNSDLLGDMFYQPVQAIPMNEPNDPNEYWADAFGNYVAGNINLTELTGEGQNMYDYVYGALSPYINP